MELENPLTSSFLFSTPGGYYGSQTIVKALESEARFYVKQMNLAQQAYRIEHGSFTANLSNLNLITTIPEQTASYTYRIVPLAELETGVIHLAVPRQPDLRSYIGQEVANSYDRTTAILCESKQPSQTAPLTPTFTNGLLVCAPGSREHK